MNPLVQAAGIKAGASLLGGLLGGGGDSYADKRKNDRLTEKAKYTWIVKGAQKAGFNPLTALQAGGGNVNAGAIPQSPLTARAALGEAIATFGGTYADDAIQRSSEARALEDWKEQIRYEQATLPPLRADGASYTKARDDTQETEAMTPDETLLQSNVVTPDGSSRALLLGPEPEEIATGMLLWGYDKVMDQFQPMFDGINNSNPRYQRRVTNPAPLTTNPRLTK